MQKICHYIDFNIANMQNICIKYAYICIKYAFHMQKYAFDMQKYAANMHKIWQFTVLQGFASAKAMVFCKPKKRSKSSTSATSYCFARRCKKPARRCCGRNRRHMCSNGEEETQSSQVKGSSRWTKSDREDGTGANEDVPLLQSSATQKGH